jgi:predicted flap endonuclease-1-like 5' DNA nuclease/peptidoglycan hydrolase CwlO-like protein
MPELTVIHIALMAITAVIGVVIGWVLRGNRADQEKAAVSAGWQDQIDAQRREGDRLLEQNKGLMEQVSQFQASHTDAKNRAKELSIAVQEAFARRDELQREIKDIRSNLEVAVNERDQLQSDMATRSSEDDIVQQKDARIEKLTQELDNWQNRLPPLIERFRTRNEEAEQLESELEEARERIRELESARENPVEEQTRIEPVTHSDELTDGLDASNDPVDDYADPLVADNDELADEPEDAEPEYEPEDEPVTGTHSLRDDLQQIKGVGPAIEKTLNEMGIFSFQQIAEMSEYDIDRVARRLKGFRSRIYREDWIGQARELRDHAIRA